MWQGCYYRLPRRGNADPEGDRDKGTKKERNNGRKWSLRVEQLGPTNSNSVTSKFLFISNTKPHFPWKYTSVLYYRLLWTMKIGSLYMKQLIVISKCPFLKKFVNFYIPYSLSFMNSNPTPAPFPPLPPSLPVPAAILGPLSLLPTSFSSSPWFRLSWLSFMSSCFTFVVVIRSGRRQPSSRLLEKARLYTQGLHGCSCWKKPRAIERHRTKYRGKIQRRTKTQSGWRTLYQGTYWKSKESNSKNKRNRGKFTSLLFFDNTVKKSHVKFATSKKHSSPLPR